MLHDYVWSRGDMGLVVSYLRDGEGRKVLVSAFEDIAQRWRLGAGRRPDRGLRQEAGVQQMELSEFSGRASRWICG
jgi:hypothetical protein